MKILFEGCWSIGQWWVGRQAICPNCGRIVRLEKGDEKSPLWAGSSSEVRVDCEMCGGFCVLTKEIQPPVSLPPQIPENAG
jgi:hypothetical protein